MQLAFGTSEKQSSGLENKSPSQAFSVPVEEWRTFASEYFAMNAHSTFSQL